jgi:hypothetical protein
LRTTPYKSEAEATPDPGSVRKGLSAEIRRIVLRCLEKDKGGNIENLNTFYLGPFLRDKVRDEVPADKLLRGEEVLMEFPRCFIPDLFSFYL